MCLDEIPLRQRGIMTKILGEVPRKSLAGSTRFIENFQPGFLISDRMDKKVLLVIAVDNMCKKTFHVDGYSTTLTFHDLTQLDFANGTSEFHAQLYVVGIL